jgi:hypothetical protein
MNSEREASLTLFFYGCIPRFGREAQPYKPCKASHEDGKGIRHDEADRLIPGIDRNKEIICERVVIIFYPYVTCLYDD